MNIEKLEVGKVFKNHKELCHELEMEFKIGTNSKNAQIKELSRFCKFKKYGHKFIIEEIYNTPLSKAYNQRRNNIIKIPLSISNPLLAAEWLIEKNGMELPEKLTRRSTEEYWWKCRKCENELYSSPLKRLNTNNGVDNAITVCPYCNMSQGAKKIYKFLVKFNLRFETEYAFNDLRGLGNKNLRFDFAVFDIQNRLISLIEFDGGYHDKDLNPDIENYNTIAAHDKKKDDYCFKNNIPLLRIHHTKSNQTALLLLEYFLKFKLSQDKIDKMNYEYNLIVKLQKEMEYHISRIDYLKTELKTYGMNKYL